MKTCQALYSPKICRTIVLKHNEAFVSKKEHEDKRISGNGMPTKGKYESKKVTLYCYEYVIDSTTCDRGITFII